jgi:hypothetical protein
MINHSEPPGMLNKKKVFIVSRFKMSKVREKLPMVLISKSPIVNGMLY